MRSQDFARSDRLSDQIKIEVSEILKEEVCIQLLPSSTSKT